VTKEKLLERVLELDKMYSYDAHKNKRQQYKLNLCSRVVDGSKNTYFCQWIYGLREYGFIDAKEADLLVMNILDVSICSKHGTRRSERVCAFLRDGLERSKQDGRKAVTNS